jgi:hypothetical protein
MGVHQRGGPEELGQVQRGRTPLDQSLGVWTRQGLQGLRPARLVDQGLEVVGWRGVGHRPQGVPGRRDLNVVLN